MSLNRVLLCALSCALLFTAKFSFAAQSHEIKAAADQEVLKLNEDCNAAELRADVTVMDKCETEDFTHTHSNGMVEHKIEFIKGVGSGAHKFLTLDWSDVHVRSYGDSAIVEGHQHLRADNLGRIADNQLAVMTVWVKQQGKWREAAWIAALISRAEPAGPQKK